MASSYKTPGVYVDEVSTLPPSVAQVETAIPAFIGYTEIAMEYAPNDLINVPTKIGSMVEYVQFFGGAPAVEVNSVALDSQNQVSSLSLDDNYYLYEAMRMFFANGGGYCYIVAVGLYMDNVIENGDTINPGFIRGLEALRKVDEPTLLLAPDASLMDQADMDSLHQAMLTQCAELQDRFSILDVRKAGLLESYQDTIDAFRDGIGMNNLKYGAAYSPWIKANLPRTVRYSDIKGKITQSGSPVTLANLINDAEAQTLANRLDKLVADQKSVATNLGLLGDGGSVQAEYERLVAVIKGLDPGNGAGQVTAAKTALKDLVEFLTDVQTYMTQSLLNTTPSMALTDTGAGSLVTFLQSRLATPPATSLQAQSRILLERLMTDANDTVPNGGLGAGTVTVPAAGYTVPLAGPKAYFLGAGNVAPKVIAGISDYNAIWNALKSQLDLIVSTTTGYLDTVEKSVVEVIPALKTIFRAISNEYLTLPPSSSIAGIYASVDASRGVWKAPANVSLNSVVGVTELIDNREQGSLNVDVIAGKSINIIRPFTGKGILVWGARTLAGNDNEWRYVSVRRFFIMVEESARKATEMFVFEGNDANTWVRVRAMIENFLTLQWRAGALAGAKPEHAFFVRVGLGQTMTANDILEGRMIVEIGMAVVRPAEFIILRFSHKMQES